MVFYPISEISSKHDVILIYFPPSTLPTYYNRVMLHILNPLMGDRKKRLTNGHGKSPNIKSPFRILPIYCIMSGRNGLLKFGQNMVLGLVACTLNPYAHRFTSFHFTNLVLNAHYTAGHTNLPQKSSVEVDVVDGNNNTTGSSS